MKKLFLILGMCAMLTACGQAAEQTEPAGQATTGQIEQAEQQDVLEYKDCTAKILGVEVYTDGEGKEAAAVSAEFTNNSSEPFYFNQMFYIRLYQNGIEQTAHESFPGEGYDWESYTTSIKDGATITVWKHRPLTNTTDPVEVEIADFGGGSIMKTFNL